MAWIVVFLVEQDNIRLSSHDYIMLELDSPLVEDIDASLRYCKDVLDEFRKIKTFNPEPEHVSFIAMGMRHYQRTIVDAATRALKAIAIDLDGSTRKIPSKPC